MQEREETSMDQEENNWSVLCFENEGEQKEYIYMITLYILYIPKQ